MAVVHLRVADLLRGGDDSQDTLWERRHLMPQSIPSVDNICGQVVALGE